MVEVPQKLRNFLEMCSKFLVIFDIYNVKNKNMEEQNNIGPDIFIGGRLPRLPGGIDTYSRPAVSIVDENKHNLINNK